MLYFDLQQEQAKSSLVVGHYQMHASAELVVLRTVVVAGHKMLVQMYMKKKREVQMYQSLQVEVHWAVIVQADLVSLEKAAGFEHLVVHVHKGDETAVKLQEQIAAQEPSAETGHQRIEEDCSTCSDEISCLSPI